MGTKRMQRVADIPTYYPCGNLRPEWLSSAVMACETERLPKGHNY